MLFFASVVVFAASVWTAEASRTGSPNRSADLETKVIEMLPWAWVGVTALVYLVTYWLCPTRRWRQATWQRALVGVTISGFLLVLALGTLFVFYIGVTLVG